MSIDLRHKTCLVVVPTYNRHEYIEATLRSILNQTYRIIKVVVLDNSTNEITREIVSKIQDDRLFYLRSGHGLSATAHALVYENYTELNKEYYNCIFFDDDLMLENHIELSICNIINSKYPISTSTALGINEHGNACEYTVGAKPRYFGMRKLRGWFGVILSCWRNPICCPALVWRGNIPMLRSMTYPDAKGFFDYSQNIKLIHKYGVSILDKPTIKLRLHSGQDSVNYINNFRKHHSNARELGLKSLDSNNITVSALLVFFEAVDAIYYTIRNLRNSIRNLCL